VGARLAREEAGTSGHFSEFKTPPSHRLKRSTFDASSRGATRQRIINNCLRHLTQIMRSPDALFACIAQRRVEADFAGTGQQIGSMFQCGFDGDFRIYAE
jgi:hypothetical protein